MYLYWLVNYIDGQFKLFCDNKEKRVLADVTPSPHVPSMLTGGRPEHLQVVLTREEPHCK
jgi:hypothetical protein